MTFIVWENAYHDLHIGNDYKYFNDADYSGNLIEIPFSVKLVDNVEYTGPTLNVETRGNYGNNHQRISLHNYSNSSGKWGLSSALETKCLDKSPISLAFNGIKFEHNVNWYFVLKIEMASVAPTSGSQQDPPFAEIAVERISLISEPKPKALNPFGTLLGFGNVPES